MQQWKLDTAGQGDLVKVSPTKDDTRIMRGMWEESKDTRSV